MESTMCLILIAKNRHPTWDLVIAANRDEFYQRPASIANYWPDRSYLLAGRDLNAGGTWLGVDTQGRIAAITNVRQVPLQAGNRSRGELVCEFLDNQTKASEFIPHYSFDDYAGFNLLVDDGQQTHCLSNRHPAHPIGEGVFGLSNAGFEAPWPKVERGKQGLALALKAHDLSSALFELLHDDVRASDQDLPDTGVGIELERLLAPIFIQSPDYGTRASTVILRNREQLIFIEKSYSNDGRISNEVSFTLSLPMTETCGLSQADE